MSESEQIQQLEMRNEALLVVAQRSIQVSMATANTARQMLTILQDTDADALAYQGVIETLIENIESYTPKGIIPLAS